MIKTENTYFEKVKKTKKKIMVIVPHEDDEINVAGGILANHAGGNAEAKVVFTTNGNRFEAAAVRQKEAMKSLKVLGVKKDNIVFLGYSDQINMRKEVWKDWRGGTETQGTKYFSDYRYAKDGYHSRFCLENMVKDIRDVVIDFLPDEIYCVDFDSHSDHRMASLAFEMAMGQILKQSEEYSPRVYKGFAYPTAFKGEPDFEKADNCTKFAREDYTTYEMQNPYYKWEHRICFPVVGDVRKKVLAKNIIYKALAKHKSQLIICQAYGIINDDQVFWQRRTDNLLRWADIEVSSGEGEYLRDFTLFDISNIMDGNREYPKFDKRIWMPDIEDAKKSISIDFKQDVDIKTLVFYLGCNTNAQIKRVKVSMDNGYMQDYEFDAEPVQRIDLELQRNVHRIQVEVLETIGDGAGFSELEVLGEDKSEAEFIKIMEDDLFCYRTDSLEDKSIYIYDGYTGKKIPLSGNVKVRKGYYKSKEGWLVEQIDNPEIYDFVEFVERTKHGVPTVISVYNKMTLGITYCWYRILRKLRNLMKAVASK